MKTSKSLKAILAGIAASGMYASSIQAVKPGTEPVEGCKRGQVELMANLALT